MTIKPLDFDEKGCLKPYGIIKSNIMVVEITEKTEAAEAIKELLLLIEDTNEMIRRNIANGLKPNDIQISGYERIRQELIGDLIELLNEFNVPLKFQPEKAIRTALAA